MLSKTNGALITLASFGLISASSPNLSDVATFAVPLTGSAQSNFANPTGGTGDPNGFGLVRLTFDPSGKKICYDFQLSGVSTPLMSHIHRGEPLQNGPPIVTLFTGPGGNLHDCVVWLRGPLSEMVPARVASTSASRPPNFPTAPCADN